MFRGFVNIWNYFSENVTALRIRDNCWGVTQRNEAMAFRGRWRATPAVLGKAMSNIRFNFRHRMVNGCSEYWLCEK